MLFQTAALVVLCRLLIFSKSTFSKNSFRNTMRVSNSLDPDIPSGLIWVQNVSKGYQQKTLSIESRPQNAEFCR